jgi:hypothetical protein
MMFVKKFLTLGHDRKQQDGVASLSKEAGGGTTLSSECLLVCLYDAV